MPSQAILIASALYLLRATGILVLTIGAALLLRRASAGTRHSVWLAAVVLILALPLFAAALPDWRILPFPSTTPAAVTSAGNEAAPVTRAPDPGLSVTALDQTRDVGSALQEGAQAAVAAEAVRSPILARLSSAVRTARPAQLFVALWIVGTILLLGRLARSTLVLRRILRYAEPLTSTGWTRPLFEVADRLNLTDAPRLLQSDRVSMPFACGLLRPTVVLPASAEEWSEPRRRAVLFHELAHIRRRDLLGHALGRCACALYWMHPLVWTAARRLRAESERACDDLVLSTGTPASEYADHLLQILVGVRANDAPVVALPMGRRREFEGRLLAILDPALRRHRPTVAHASVLVAFCLVAGALAAVAPVEAAGPDAATLATIQQADHSSPATASDRFSDDSDRLAQPEQPAQHEASAPHGLIEIPSPPDPLPAPRPQPAQGSPSFGHAVEEMATEFGWHISDAVGGFITSGLQFALGNGEQQPKNVPLLIRLLRTDESAEVRRMAAWGLHDVDDEAAVAALARAAREDADAEVREMATWALHGLASPEVVSAFVAVTRDNDAAVRGRAAWGLAQTETPDPAALNALTRLLTDGDADVRLRAAWALGTLEPESAPSTLYLRTLHDADPEVRVAAAWALGQIVDPAARPALAERMQQEREAEPLKATLRALTRLGSIEPAALEALLVSEDPEVRAEAIRLIAGGVGRYDVWAWPWPEPRPMP